MSWKKINLGEFLKVRENRFKPNDKAIVNLKRIDKIDFSGEIFISDKPSNTDMILIKKGDLVISGINVEKGAMAIYRGEQDITATIHYSSYSFNEGKIDIEFLKYFLKSIEFRNALKEQVPGGIKTEIKPKHLLPLIVEIPTNVKEQREVVQLLQIRNLKADAISTELAHQRILVKKLRQQLLQEAVKGKLATKMKEGESAKELINELITVKLKYLKGIEKKEKELSPIKPDEIPYNIPENWEWCKLGTLFDIVRGSSPRPKGDPKYFSKSRTSFHWITIADFAKHGKANILLDTTQFLTEEGSKQSRFVDSKDLLIAASGVGSVGKSIQLGIKGFIYDGIMAIKNIPNQTLMTYLAFYLKVKELEIYSIASGANWLNINTDLLNNYLVPLPPLNEQIRIVQKLEELIGYCEKLEFSIGESESQNEKLLQQVLKEALKKESRLTIPENKVSFAKQVLGGKIVSLYKNDNNFTHIKFQKLQYLAENIIQADLNWNYYRQTAGPYDNKFMHSVAYKLKANKWFEENNYKFKPLAKANEIEVYYQSYFGSVNDKLETLFTLLKKATEAQCEILATTYAVWNNMIIKNEGITDDKIIKYFFEWSTRKEKYSEKQVLNTIAWIKDKGFEPTGFGYLIKEKKKNNGQ